MDDDGDSRLDNHHPKSIIEFTDSRFDWCRVIVEMIESSPNIASAILAGIVSILCTFGVVIMTDKRKIRVTANEREVEARADYVELLQKRVLELENRIDIAVRREGEMTDYFRREQSQLERRYRHLVSGLIQYSISLNFRLKKLGVTDIPEFNGWDKFMEEGGIPPEQWRNALKPDADEE